MLHSCRKEETEAECQTEKEKTGGIREQGYRWSNVFYIGSEKITPTFCGPTAALTDHLLGRHTNLKKGKASVGKKISHTLFKA